MENQEIFSIFVFCSESDKALDFTAEPVYDKEEIPFGLFFLTDPKGEKHESLRKILKICRLSHHVERRQRNGAEHGKAVEARRGAPPRAERARTFGRARRPLWLDRKSTRLNSSHRSLSRMPSSA